MAKITVRKRTSEHKNPIVGFIAEDPMEFPEAVGKVYDEMGLVQVLDNMVAGGAVILSKTTDSDIEEYLSDLDNEDAEGWDFDNEATDFDGLKPDEVDFDQG